MNSFKGIKAEYSAIQRVHYAVFGSNIRRKKQELITELETKAKEEGKLMTLLILDAIYYCNIVERIRGGKEQIEQGSQAWYSYIGRFYALERILENYRKL